MQIPVPFHSCRLATRFDENRDREPRWCWSEIVGRLIEISGTGAVARLTAAAGLLVQAQLAHEPTAWITGTQSTFFAPDFHQTGIDLAALVVIVAPNVSAQSRAIDRLLHSGAFGLIVADFDQNAEIPMATQGRLARLAQRHNTAVVFLTDKPDTYPSLGSMVSLRVAAQALHAPSLATQNQPGFYRYQISALKDKQHSPHWNSSETVRAPLGLH